MISVRLFPTMNFDYLGSKCRCGSTITMAGHKGDDGKWVKDLPYHLLCSSCESFDPVSKVKLLGYQEHFTEGSGQRAAAFSFTQKN